MPQVSSSQLAAALKSRNAAAAAASAVARGEGAPAENESVANVQSESEVQIDNDNDSGGESDRVPADENDIHADAEESDAADATDPVATRRPRVAAKSSELTDRQEIALAELAAGKSICAAAKAANVHRTTVSNWLRTDTLFRSAYNAWRLELTESARSRLLQAANSAVSTVVRAVRKGDARLAMLLLDRLGLNAATPTGPADPDQVMEEIAVEHQEIDSAIRTRFNRSKYTLDGYDREQLHRIFFRMIEGFKAEEELPANGVSAENDAAGE